MRKVILLFSILLCCSMVAKSSQIDKKYLEGGIPNVYGSVVFQKKIPNEAKASPKKLYQNLLLWVESKTEKSDKDLVNSVLYENFDDFELAARLQTKLVFKNAGIILDDAIMQYVLKIKVYDDFVDVTIQNIDYDYYDKELKKDLRIKSTWIPAEKIISDDVSMNKQKNRLFKPYDKFRMFTIDEIENIYSQISTCIGNKKALENVHETKNDDSKIVLTPSTIETESIIIDSESIEPTSEIGDAELIYKDENILIIAGNKDGFCIETPISYSLEKTDNIINVYIELEETSCVSKTIETGIYTLVIYKDEYEQLLTSMSNQKKFTLDTFHKLGLHPVELPSKNIGLENAKICMTVEANPERTRIVRQKKKSNKIFVGKIFEQIP